MPDSRTYQSGVVQQLLCEVPLNIQYIHGYGSIPINTIFRGMNIHLPAILRFTRGTRFWPIPTSPFVLGLFLPSADLAQQINHHIFHSIWPAKIFFFGSAELGWISWWILGSKSHSPLEEDPRILHRIFYPPTTGRLAIARPHRRSIEHWASLIWVYLQRNPWYPTVSHCIFPHAVCLGLCSNPKLGTKSCSYSFLVFRKDFRDCPSPMDPDYIPIIPHCWTLYKLFYNSPFKSASNVINTHWIPFKFPFKSHSNPIQIPIQIPFKSHSNSLSVLQTRNVVLTILPKAFLLFPSPQCQHLGPASPVDLTWKYWLPSCIYIYIYITLYITCVYYIYNVCIYI